MGYYGEKEKEKEKGCRRGCNALGIDRIGFGDVLDFGGEVLGWGRGGGV